MTNKHFSGGCCQPGPGLGAGDREEIRMTPGLSLSLIERYIDNDQVPKELENDLTGRQQCLNSETL